MASAGLVTAAAASAAVVTTALSLAGNPPGHPAHTRLAAWTVAKLADGNISVTINQFKDPAGLQRKLRADGVPASVTFVDQRNPACQRYPGGTPRPAQEPTPLLKHVFPRPYQGFPGNLLPTTGPARTRKVTGPNTLPGSSVAIVIDPSALPGNAGVQLATTSGAATLLVPRVVYASAQCTGN
jgi:hypothetical protein